MKTHMVVEATVTICTDDGDVDDQAGFDGVDDGD